jgi:excinuclease ABC subunit C
MDYYIGLCPAPCMLDPQKVYTHSQHIEKLKDFLGGNTHTVFTDMEADMYAKAKNMEFEEAKKIKDTLAALKSMYEKQTVRDVVGGDYDICVIHTKYDHKWVGICEVRDGQIL